jgi:hypothetical protein
MGELDVIKSPICLDMPALASTTAGHEDMTARSESFEKDMVVGKQPV